MAEGAVKANLMPSLIPPGCACQFVSPLSGGEAALTRLLEQAVPRHGPLQREDENGT